MIPRQEPLDGQAVLFASGGASGHTTPDTTEAFRLARRLGATGIDTSVMVTADGTLVLRSEPTVGRVRRRRVEDLTHAELGADAVSVEHYYEVLGPEGHLMVRITDDAVDRLVALARDHEAADRLWLIGSPADLRAWRARHGEVRLVDVTAVADMSGGPERHAADLREAGIDALALRYSDWTGGRTALFHRFGRRCVGLDAPHERMIRSMLHIGGDAVSSPFPDRLADAATAHAAPDAPAFLD